MSGMNTKLKKIYIQGITCDFQTINYLNIFYYLPEQMDKVQMSAYNLQGQRVWTSDTFKNTSGRTKTSIDLSTLNTGIYFLVVDVIRSGEVKKREVKQIILNK